ncbi:MAG: hypothetical protein HZB31_07720 [Nitrospirae bacterium]|nr:hypothetical protein [Nitrospirota bacterium]
MKISEPSILIRISQKYQDGMSGQALLEITRGIWKVGTRREKAQYAFIVRQNESRS